MARKLATYKGYDTLNTYYSDPSLLSPDIFDISFFPNNLTVGKNLIKFRGNLNSLKVGAPIDVEILDSNGDTIYSEFIDYIDQDGSRVLSIYIYEDTAPGDATVIFVTEITKINDQQIPNNFQNQLNAKWTRTIPVNPLDLNTSTVIFDDLPKVTISENVGVQLNRTYTNGQFPIYNTGQISFISQNNQPTAILTGGKFNGDMINGTLSVPTPSNPLPTSDINASSTSYTSTISKVLNDTTLQLDFPYEVFDTQSNLSHTFNSFDNSAFQIEYEATPQYTPTQNSESFALIQISDLEPDTGDISRIKVYLNSAGTVGTFEQVNDILLPNTEIFIDSTSSLTPDKSLGIFETQSIIDTYWEGHSYQGKTEIAAPTLTWTTSSINNATAIAGTLDLSNSNNVYTFQLKNQFSGIFVSQSMYTVTLDAFTQKSGNLNPILSIYASGSAFTFDSTDNFNQELPKKLGKKIGEIECLGTSKRYDDISFEFNSDQSGTGVLIFVIESGDWQISDIRTLTDAEYGYTPNYTRFRTEIPTKIKSGNQLSFKIEYYNRLGDKSNTVNFVRNLNFEGGNRYIDGGFSMLTGSLFVADTLSSGVEISGLQNTGYVRSLGYEGFNQATGSSAGGFLLFSGSALPQQSETTYQGVGLEMVADANNYFRFRTNPSILDIRTETIFLSGSNVDINTPKFFLGQANGVFISGSNGNLAISASNFSVTQDGAVAANRMQLSDYLVADLVMYRIVKIQSGNKIQYYENYVYDSKNFTRIMLDGSLGGDIATQVRIETLPDYPIGEIITPNSGLGVGDGDAIQFEVAVNNLYLAKKAKSNFTDVFHADSDDWHYPLFQTRTIGSTQYGTPPDGTLGSQYSLWKLNSGCRIQFLKSTNDYRPVGISSFDWGSDTTGLANFHRGLSTAAGPIYVGGGVGNTNHTSAALQIDSTTQGFLPPRMTTTQRNSITAAEGLIIYNTTTNKHEGYDGVSWNAFW
jgi:hypothetical protein